LQTPDDSFPITAQIPSSAKLSGGNASGDKTAAASVKPSEAAALFASETAQETTGTRKIEPMLALTVLGE
jgi:hypothetical protein